ncbi:phospholipase D family protein [Jannaschia sp. W003]|uniref:phospholipase D family protein n=1 Tax=Jannaschia sp. W003 TaxID=2867012 RepID=UPI002882D469|nr:phospholipase D family protein [Jannaschia sp. W003]
MTTELAAGEAMATTDGDGAPVEILVTAAEAYPAFERLVLGARREITAGFRIFDMSTRLRSDEAQAVGRDWFDLLLHVVRRGVRLRLLLSDFDPVVGTELHGLTWRTMRQAAALAELAGPDARIEAIASLHPARIGVLARLALWPRVDRMLREKAADLLHLERPRRARFLQGHPHLRRLLMVDEDRTGPRRWPLPPLAPVTHHQKVAAVDGEVLYVGGLDLNERRWDSPRHEQPAEETWHDVQAIVRDPAAARALAVHLDELEDVIHLRAAPSDLGGRILRTVSARRRRGPLALSPKERLSEINDAIIGGIRTAERLIYLETQFLRSSRIASELARAARRAPGLELVVILPARPEDVAFLGARREDARFGEFLQYMAVRRIRRAFRGRVFVGSPARPVTAQTQGRDVFHGAPMIYVHSKVCTFDDRLAIVSSANLNGRSMHWDTEVGVPLRDPATVRHVRLRCMGAMLGGAIDPAPFAEPGGVGHWQRLAIENARTRPEARRGFMLPHLSTPARRFGRKLATVPEEMV